jgi:hypothetical protein
MAEEKIDISTPTNDDLNVLRVLLHNIKGISPVSTITDSVVFDGEDSIS